MYVNAKMIPVETITRIRGKEDKGEPVERMDIFDIHIYLI
jgi:hypothetical protein